MADDLDTPTVDGDHFHTQPPAIVADDLDSYPVQGDPYAGIPQFANAVFSTTVDAPPASVPPALGPQNQWLSAPQDINPVPPLDDDAREGEG